MSKRIPRNVRRLTKWIESPEGWKVEFDKQPSDGEIIQRLANLEDLEELVKNSSCHSKDVCEVLEKYYIVKDSRQKP